MQSLSLNGAWQLRWSDGVRGRLHDPKAPDDQDYRDLATQVPGDVHSTLIAAGIIAEPTAGTNVLAARWVEECEWSYRREFAVPAAALASGVRAFLHFERLDLVARVFLNGEEVASHQNFFYPCRVDVTGKLRPHNMLVVHIESGLFSVADKAVGPWLRWGDFRLHKRHWLRKPQCQFNWDWAQRLINVGISGEVRVEYSAAPFRLESVVPLVEVSEDLNRAAVRVRAFVECFSAEPVKARLAATLDLHGETATAEVTLRPGTHAYELTLGAALVPEDLWWPAGHGAQPLTTIRTSVEVAGHTEERTQRIGLRRLRVNQDPHPASGNWFTVEINNRPIFCKGANFVPPDMLYARITRQAYVELVDRALEAHCNFLRVWGGGTYEADAFYDLCDERGILVWQEFIFSNAKYPAFEPAFLADVKREAVFNIRRLAPHPSLIVWCGNNEIDMDYWMESPDYAAGYMFPDHALFHFVLPRIMKQEDPTRLYWPSSPHSPGNESPFRPDVGNHHPWDVSFARNDFRAYRKMTYRFPVEGGVLGPTALPTMLACLPEGQRTTRSFAWQIHDNSIGLNNPGPNWNDHSLELFLGKRLADLSVEEYTYWGGVLQGEALKEYIENFRRRMFDSAAAVFWMFNDCWPATRSWTMVDFYRRRTPMFWSVKRAMKPVHITMAEDGEHVRVFGINETQETVAAELRYGVMHLTGGAALDLRAVVRLPPNASTELASFAKAQWEDPVTTLAFAVLTRGSEIVAANRLILPLFKELRWPRSEIRVEHADGRARFHSPTFAWAVCLDLSGECALADNMFDLLPGVPHEIDWPHSTPPRILHTGNL